MTPGMNLHRGTHGRSLPPIRSTGTWRAAMDALVANAYGLDRQPYEHILASFTHKSFRAAPALCLASFDELRRIGLDAFCREHDPYAEFATRARRARR